MNNLLTTLISLIAAAGLGGVVGAYFQARFQQHAAVSGEEHELKQKRYLCVLILMLSKLEPKLGLEKIWAHRSDIRNERDLDDELRTEWLNGMVYTDDEVLSSLAGFIQAPSHDRYVETVRAMRKDLWKRKSNVSLGWLKKGGA